MHHALAFYDGFCADCHVDMPLVLIERGPRGVRAWLAGIGSEDRALTYTCRVCGRNEHVPLTEAEDVVYDATLATWPDTVFALPTYAGADAAYDDYPEYSLPTVAWQPVAGDVFAQAALQLATAPVLAPAEFVEQAPVFAPAAALVEQAPVFAPAAALVEQAPVAEPLVAVVPERRRPLVRRVDALPRQRVYATDGLPLSLAVA